MPYLREPPWARKAETFLRVCLYLSVFVAGIGATFFTPITISAVVGATIMKVSGLVLMGSAAISVFGAGARNYRFEWTTIWLIAASCFIYTLSVWTLVDAETLTRLTQSGWVSVAFFAVLIRGVQLTVTASKNREAHKMFRS